MNSNSGQTVPIAGLTEHETLVDILDVSKDDVVLITAASGGVGHLAVQLAKHLAARVVAATSGQHAEFVAALGAGGHMVALPGAITAQRPDVRIDRGYVARGDGARLQTVSDLIDAGVLRVEIREVFPFDRAPAALDKVLTKHVIGKVALGIR